MRRISESELIINADGSIFHLHLKPEMIGDYVILVGDPGRVKMISARLDEVFAEVANREFVSCFGRIGTKTLTVLSTGIGIDNIDIVLNELDALVNIDLENRTEKVELTKLKLIRIGTSGAVRPEIVVDSTVVSKYAVGLDGLLQFYRNLSSIRELESLVKGELAWMESWASPYAFAGSESLIQHFNRPEYVQGITFTAHGFYAPQGRRLRLETAHERFNELLSKFHFNGIPATNYEMETSALYGLGKLMGHECLTMCTIIANRMAGTYSPDYKRAVEILVEQTLETISNT
jgi:uridine phosphorylase